MQRTQLQLMAPQLMKKTFEKTFADRVGSEVDSVMTLFAATIQDATLTARKTVSSFLG